MPLHKESLVMILGDSGLLGPERRSGTMRSLLEALLSMVVAMVTHLASSAALLCSTASKVLAVQTLFVMCCCSLQMK